jgi:hypothetical protein
MKLPRFCLLPLLALAPVIAPAAEKSSGPSYANEADRLRAALIAADTERLEATKLGDRARLAAIFSDDLHYAHSSGKVDNKASLIESLASKASVYESFSYQDRKFTPIGVGLATMTGRVLVKVGPPGKPNDLDLSFLAIWREENGKWRFLGWQSCKMAAPATPAAK